MPSLTLDARPRLDSFEVTVADSAYGKFDVRLNWKATYLGTPVLVSTEHTSLAEPLAEDFWTVTANDAMEAAYSDAGWVVPA